MVDEPLNGIIRLKGLKDLLQYDEMRFHQDYMDQILQDPMLGLLVVHFQLTHKDQKSKFQVQKVLLHEKLQNQNKEDPIKKDEFQKFLVNLRLDLLFWDHGIIQDPNIPNAK